MNEAIVLIIVVTSLWVLVDSMRIGVKKGKIKGLFDMGPAGWFFSCLLIWIVAFPAYLVKRDELRQTTPMGNSPPLAGADIPSQIGELADLKARGLLTDEEFQTKKKELLSRM